MENWCYCSRVYFSSGTVEEPVKVGQVSDRGESVAILPSMPKHVIQAFSLLQGSPEAQVSILHLTLPCLTEG